MSGVQIRCYQGSGLAAAPQASAVAGLRCRELLAPEGLVLVDYAASDRRCVHFVAAWGAELAGYVQFDPTGDRLRQLVVAPRFRGQSIGRQLVERVSGAARGRGATVLWVHAWLGSRDFYRRVGFEPAGAVCADAGVPWQPMRMLLPA